MLPRLLAPLLCLAVHFSIPATADAQEGGRKIRFRTVCLQHLDDITEVKLPTTKSGGGTEELEVPLFSGTFSEQLEAVFAGDTATFYVEDSDAPEGRRPVASGKLGQAEAQVLLFLPPVEKDSKLTYRVMALSDAEKDFPMGGVRLLNLCAGPVRLNIAGADLKPVATNQSAVYPPVRAVDEWNMYQVRIDYGTADGKWVPVSTPSWKSSELKRDLVITTLDPRSRQPRIYNYKDIPPWRKAKLEVPE